MSVPTPERLAERITALEQRIAADSATRGFVLLYTALATMLSTLLLVPIWRVSTLDRTIEYSAWQYAQYKDTAGAAAGAGVLLCVALLGCMVAAIRQRDPHRGLLWTIAGLSGTVIVLSSITEYSGDGPHITSTPAGIGLRIVCVVLAVTTGMQAAQREPAIPVRAEQ